MTAIMEEMVTTMPTIIQLHAVPHTDLFQEGTGKIKVLEVKQTEKVAGKQKQGS